MGPGILFSGTSFPCAGVCAGVWWSVKGVGGEKRLQLGSGCQKKPPTTSTKRRVHRNIPQNRLGRTLKPDMNLLLCFKASLAHPPPSTLSGSPHPTPQLWNSPALTRFEHGTGEWLQLLLGYCQLFLKKQRVHLSVPVILSQRQGSAQRVPMSLSCPLPVQQPGWKLAGEEEQRGDRECRRVELGGLILPVVNHYLPHNLFLFSRGFTGSCSQKQMRNMWQTASEQDGLPCSSKPGI